MSMNRSEETELKKRLKNREDMFLRRLFAMLAKMAKADSKVDAWETHAAERAFAQFPRAAARRKFCVWVFNESKNGRKSLYRLAWEFANKWATPEDCLKAYELLWDIACATGVLKPAHKSNLEGICKYLNLPGSYFGIYYRKRRNAFREWSEADEERERETHQSEEARWWSDAQRRQREARSDYRQRAWEWFERHDRGARQRVADPVLSPLQREYATLGVPSTASDEEVRKAYHVAAKRCHPDILRAAGCSEERAYAATQKMAQINAAWEKIRKERNI